MKAAILKTLADIPVGGSFLIGADPYIRTAQPAAAPTSISAVDLVGGGVTEINQGTAVLDIKLHLVSE